MSEPTREYTWERRVADLERVLDVTRQLGASVELDPLLARMAEAATSVLDCERATVFLYDRNTDELFSRFATGVTESGMKEIRFPVTRGISGEVARTGKLINIADAYADSRFNPDIDRESGFKTRNLLTFPLTGHDGTVVGVLQVLNKRQGGFDRRDEQLVHFLGAQAGVAVQRQLLLEHFAEKKRIQQDLNIAREIQQGLLPQSNPELAGFDVAGWNRPADETGGDCYDFMPLASGELAITIADATGHGIGPALVIAETRALFRATIYQTRDLGMVVSHVNHLLNQDLPDDKFVTAFFGLLYPNEGKLRFTSAGHGPILSFEAATGEIKEMKAQGMPLGIMADAVYEQPVELALAAGDIVALFTDGFFEWARADSEQFGLERLHKLIQAGRDMPAAELIQHIYHAVLDFAAGTPQIDDLTAVLIKKL